MLGFGGHFSTKSRRYSTTLTALRTGRTHWRRGTHPDQRHHDVDTDPETTLLVGRLTFSGAGWRTTADALLAATAAAKAREHRHVIRELRTAPSAAPIEQAA